MKKQLFIGLCLALMSAQVFASKARLEALGEDRNGSYIVQDYRNIFYSPAQALMFKDLVAIEWGESAGSDTASEPRAEGGVLKSWNNMVLGVYFGQESDEGNALRSLAGTGTSEMNNVTALLAGEAGLQWGVSLTYGTFINEGDFAGPGGTYSDGEANLARANASVILGDWEFYARANLLNEAEGTFSGSKQSFEGKAGWQIGAIHVLDNMRYALIASGLGGENENGADYDYSAYEIQVGSVQQLNDRASVNFRTGFKMQEETDGNFITKSVAGEIGDAFNPNSEAELMTIPVVLGLEVQAKDWMVLRTSLEHALWSSLDDGTNESTLADTTMVNGGVGFEFSDLMLDLSLSKSSGTDRGRASVTYKF